MPLLKDDKKAAALLIVKRMNGNAERAPENEDGDMMDSEPGMDAASEEMMQAIESKDRSALKSALKSFIEMTMTEMKASEQEEQES